MALPCNRARTLAAAFTMAALGASVGQAAATPALQLGAGLTLSNFDGCAPALKNDFIDKAPWHTRRVEPADCSATHLSTPIFSWTLPWDIHRGADKAVDVDMVLEVTKIGATGPYPYSHIIPTKVPRLLLNSELTGGEYAWTVSYTTTKNVVVKSVARRFVVADGAFPLPSGATLAANLANRAHPRALPDGASFDALAKAAAEGDYRAAYAAFAAEASNLLTQEPPPSPVNPGGPTGSSAYIDWWVGLMHVGKKELAAIETLGYAGRFFNATAYDNAGMKRLVSLANWDPRGVTSEAFQEQANREIYLTLALGLDLYGSKLSADDRALVVKALMDRLGQVQPKFAALDQNPYNPHMVTNTSYFTEALMYAVGSVGGLDEDKLKPWLAKAWEDYVTMLGAWGGSTDGGFGNGNAYGWYALTPSSRMMAAARLIANVDVTRLPAAGDFGDNQIAFTPPGVPLRGQFGDDLENTGHYADYSSNAYRLYASVTGKPEHEWYWRARPSNVQLSVPLQPMHYLLLGLRTPRAPDFTPQLPNAWVFEDAGVVAMHSQTTVPLRSSVFFRSSRFGSGAHMHGDNNAFTFVSKGKEMLISGGYYTGYGSPHHSIVTRATRYKNALTYDGGIGQSEPANVPTAPGPTYSSMDTRGGLINFGDTGEWAFTSGDAQLAYRGRPLGDGLPFKDMLGSAIRSVAFNRQEGVVVIYDWATTAPYTTGPDRNWELNFNMIEQPVWDGATLRIGKGASQDRVEACVDIYGPAGNIQLTKGFAEPVPAGFKLRDRSPMIDQYQARWRVAAPSKQLRAVTVIREDCRAVPVAVTFANDTQASVSINGAAPVIFDRKTISIP